MEILFADLQMGRQRLFEHCSLVATFLRAAKVLQIGRLGIWGDFDLYELHGDV